MRSNGWRSNSGVSTTTATRAAWMAPASIAARRTARPRRRAAVDEDQDAIGDERQLLARDRVLELALDAPGDQPQGELAQGRQVRLGEELLERDLGPIGRVDVAVLHPLPERVGAHVDELDLVGGQQDLVGEALVDRRAGDRGDRVGDALEVLDVHRASRRGCRRRG